MACGDGPVIGDIPSERWRQTADMVVAQIQQVRVALLEQIEDHDLAGSVAKDDRRIGAGVASHLGAGSHEACC